MDSIISYLDYTVIFNKFDIHFAEFIVGLDGNKDPDLFLSAALISKIAADGDTCLDLSKYAGKVLVEEHPRGDASVVCPSLAAWRQKLRASRVVGIPGDFTPLVLDDKDRLYLYRYWEYQQRLADAIRLRLTNTVNGIDYTLLKLGLKRLFSSKLKKDEIDWLQIAAIAAVTNRFCVISGGPGTGKTFLTANILTLLIEQAGTTPLRIFLAAPTGKAASRLIETIQNTKPTLNCDESVRNAIPSMAYTIHRLMGTIPHSPYFRHRPENPLPADVVIIDEASMVDLALMSKLFQALPSDTRVILLGDRDQLASVESGAVLGDICDPGIVDAFSPAFCERVEFLTDAPLIAPTAATSSRLRLEDSVVLLKNGFRFLEKSGIDGLSQAVKGGHTDEAVNMFADPTYAHIEMQAARTVNEISSLLIKLIKTELIAYLDTADPAKSLERFNRFQILCAVRKGRFGIEAINHLVEQLLLNESLIKWAPHEQNPFYRGRPILITRNDYNLGLYNGDIGVTLPDPNNADGPLYVFFPEASGGLKRVSPYRLPEHETVYAMTVHKSQGSEFEKILLILPDMDSPLLTRELIYTGITRAKEHVVVCGSPQILQAAISRQTDRTSGLRNLLWQ